MSLFRLVMVWLYLTLDSLGTMHWLLVSDNKVCQPILQINDYFLMITFCSLVSVVFNNRWVWNICYDEFMWCAAGSNDAQSNF